ncbi:MAG: hypothetical protein IT454_12235 [Planctomycetes bacterium]|nr:hypothetical protein [Planctomycetota bacterium]
MARRIPASLRCAALASAAFALAPFVSAQSFTQATVPASVGYTENADFADIDGDGDRDAALAHGGDQGNLRNSLWINQGFLQSGTVGAFSDGTSTRFPAVLDQSRDFDWFDFDGDGDFDALICNTSSLSSQSNRLWVNMGGAQGGTAGFFQDQTSTRWTFLGVNNGTTHRSSLPPSLVLGSGGFVDWSCDAVAGDLDNDGDQDIYHSSYGGAFSGATPSRLFLNDGSGLFEEYNPSGYQLSNHQLVNGAPALWCQGVQQNDTLNATGVQADLTCTSLGVELGDLDGDFDIDAFQGSRNTMPRTFRNRLSDTGSFTAFRDVTGTSGYLAYANGSGKYEQELGDLDNDNDLDLYGVNFQSPNFNDTTALNNGLGVFSFLQTTPNSFVDDNDADFFDYDCDGDLDVYVCAFSGQNQLQNNTGASGGWLYTNVTATHLPAVYDVSLGGDSCDTDLDGDFDFLATNNSNYPNRLYVNTTQVPDTTAPRVPLLEQLPDRGAGPTASIVRAHVYDNVSWDVLRYDDVRVEYSWNGGSSWHSEPMLYSGGQVFRGAFRGDIAGTIQYRVRATDEHGNVGLSTTKSFVASGCTGNVVTYCTAGTSTNGCNASVSASGTPSLSAPNGFVLTATGVEGAKLGLIFYGTNGAHAVGWGAGSSFACVKSPTQRTPASSSGGTSGACDGSLQLDWLAFLASHPGALGAPFAAGQQVNVQCWYRDPPAPKTTSLSNALEFTTCP